MKASRLQQPPRVPDSAGQSFRGKEETISDMNEQKRRERNETGSIDGRGISREVQLKRAEFDRLSFFPIWTAFISLRLSFIPDVLLAEARGELEEIVSASLQNQSES